MGFTDFLMNIMQKFSPVDLSLERYTQKELTDMKKQGYKVEEVQKYLDLYEKGEHPKQIKEAIRIEKNRIKNQSKRLRFEELSETDLLLEEIPNPTDLSKLEPFLAIPINQNMEIIKKSLDGDANNEKSFIGGQLALTSVVQAAPEFWEKEGEIQYAAFVFTYIEKGNYINNTKFLKKICSMLNDFRDEDNCPEAISREMKKLYNDLNSPKSEFHVHIDQSLLDFYQFNFEENRVISSDIIVATSYKIQIEKDLLPNKSFPSDGILPLICLSEKMENGKEYPYFKFVNGEYYKL